LEVYPVFQGRLPGELPDALIVMGGPMNIYERDRYPWLNIERMWIRYVIEQDRPVLGICLGAQLLADILGGRVVPNGQKEIGWYPVTWNDAALSHRFFHRTDPVPDLLHWHGDRFELPPDARLMAGSQACPTQAFVWNEQVVGLQFHAEMQPGDVQRLARHSAAELAGGGPFVQSGEEMLAESAHFVSANRWMERFLDRFIR
jgi:GMP synthase (glutamine-hydrolysing)